MFISEKLASVDVPIVYVLKEKKFVEYPNGENVPDAIPELQAFPNAK